METTVVSPAKNISIIKADGAVERFEPEKLAASLRRAGAGMHTAARIAGTITATAPKEVNSHEVYRKAFAMLRREARPAAARYALRRALLEFGPSGHPFEDFVAQLFSSEGWKVEWRKIIKGRCVSHEVDVYATRGNETMAAELKYHNDAFYKTDVKVALYVKARFDDIWNCDPRVKTCPMDRGFLITNTKFTSQAIDYGTCAGIELVGWNYPEQGNLYDRIIASGLYPITTLTMLKKAEKKLLINNGIVTSSMLRDNREALRSIGVPSERIGGILGEIESLRSPMSYAT
ncbi:MAG: restriction endonuclease [Minisyncoccia bacterium]